jgi:putative oxidoreductase
MSRLLRLVARATLSAIFISSGVDLIQNPEGRTKRAADALPGVPELPMIGRIHGATMLTAGTTMALGILPRLSAGVLAASLVPNTYVGHPFWKEEDAGARRGQQVQFLKNLGLFGGLIALILEEQKRGTR